MDRQLAWLQLTAAAAKAAMTVETATCKQMPTCEERPTVAVSRSIQRRCELMSVADILTRQYRQTGAYM